MRALWAFVASLVVQLFAPNHNLDSVAYIYRPLQVVAAYCALAFVVLSLRGTRKD